MKKSKAKRINMHVENTETFPKKKKTKSVNMLTNDIKFFLKILINRISKSKPVNLLQNTNLSEKTGTL